MIAEEPLFNGEMTIGVTHCLWKGNYCQSSHDMSEVK